jgi:lysophospholipid acyltransferase (LPLAT)-like uncharacterized protein
VPVLKRAGRAIAGRLGPGAARLLARSWQVRIVGRDELSIVAATRIPFVLVCWHDALLPVMWHHRGQGIAAVISEARDGSYLASFAGSLGYRVIRGSSTRSAKRALLGAIRALRGGVSVGITPDGPAGPRRVLKPGAVSAAQQGRAVILPVHAEARPGWRASSWDRFLVPPAFAHVRVAYGTAFHVGHGPRGLEDAVIRCTNELDEAARLAAWPDGAETRTA